VTEPSAGQARIEWADGQMPVLAQVRERLARERPLQGVRVGACLHVTAETANLVRALIAGGAEVSLCAANPLSTQDDVAAALVAHHGAQVHAVRGESAEQFAEHIQAVVERDPQVTIDDGADLVGTIHLTRPEQAAAMLGGMEETTAGLLRVRALEAQGLLACPVLAVNESRTERAFNDRFGTGQSTIDGILRATNLLLAGRTVVVLGYGWTGRGVALRARGAGASVIVCEVDALRALEARMEGYEVMGALAAAERGDVFVTVTGGRDVLRAEHFERMKDGAVLANSGHFDVEISIEDLRKLAKGPSREVLPLVEQYTLPDGRRLNLLAHGRVVNLAAGEGHPASVMDVSFAVQALCVEYLLAHAGELSARVLEVPEAIDSEVARLKLDSLGVEIDELTEDQRVYRSSWEQGA
jgi:adenosylhomocysteinase